MRAIDADRLKEVLEKNFGHTGGAAVLAQLIDAQDTIQPEIVRCKDYKHRYVEGDNVRYNTCELNHNNVQSDDWFCADGERREVTE